jgi:hypothetical protein
VQAYATLALLALSILLLAGLPARRQAGDAFGLALLGIGVAVFITEFWRDPEGRGALLGGALNAPQLAAVLLVLAGGVALLERKGTGLEWRTLALSTEEQNAGSSTPVAAATIAQNDRKNLAPGVELPGAKDGTAND